MVVLWLLMHQGICFDKCISHMNIVIQLVHKSSVGINRYLIFFRQFHTKILKTTEKLLKILWNILFDSEFIRGCLIKK